MLILKHAFPSLYSAEHGQDSKHQKHRSAADRKQNAV